MGRTGKGADDIFARTTPTAKPAAGSKSAPARATATSAARGRGRPVAHEEPTTKATTILYNRQIAQLDRLSSDIRERSGHVVNRADLIRAILDAALSTKIDLGAATSEEDVRRLVAAHLKK